MTSKSGRHAIKAAKASLILAKKVLGKSPQARRVGKGIVRTLFPHLSDAVPYGYNFFKHYPTVPEYYAQQHLQEALEYRPVISLIMPTYNTDHQFLKECIESVLMQSYSNWELCIADDASTDKRVSEIVQEYAKQEPRIKFIKRETNGHISLASNSALELASGEFVALLDHDDILWPNALYEITSVLNDDRSLDLIYSDEDKVDEDTTTHSYPFFKPDWSPEFLESCNYITHFSCVRTSLMHEIKGFRKGYEGAQDWDLFLRITERSKNIRHLPKVLYSWRVHQRSTAHNTDAKPYVFEAQRRSLEDHLSRSGKKGTVRTGLITQHRTIDYDIVGEPTVTVLIAGDDPAKVTRLLGSLNKHDAGYPAQYILLSDGAAAKQSWPQSVTLLRVSGPPAQKFNLAAQQLQSDYIVFFTQDNEIKDNLWLRRLISDAQSEGVGFVAGTTVYGNEPDVVKMAGRTTHPAEVYFKLLNGLSIQDLDSIQTLYGQSRRNVIALDLPGSAIARDKFLSGGGFNINLPQDYSMVELCLRLHGMGLRHIFTPYVSICDYSSTRAKDQQPTKPSAEIVDYFKQHWAKEIAADPYHNPSFLNNPNFNF